MPGYSESSLCGEPSQGLIIITVINCQMKQSLVIMKFNDPLKVCQNTIGSYTCYCKPQFVDDGNGNCVNRDECQEGVCPITGVTG